MNRFDFEAAEQALTARDAQGLTAVLDEAYAGWPDAVAVSEWVDFVFEPRSAPPHVDQFTLPFIHNIRRLRGDAKAQRPLAHGPSQQVIGEELDFLGDPAGIDWSPPQALNYLMMSAIPARRTAAVVGTMRDDGIYALEWIAHHLALGFEHLFLYTNDNADGSEELLRCLASYGVITLIESVTAGTVPPEVKAFEHSVHLLPAARDFEWLLFVDSDEFLMPAQRYQNDIRVLLAGLASRYPDQLPAGILYEWLWYVSDMVYERRPGLLMERFQHAKPHWLTKALVRTRDLVSMRPQHHPTVKPGRFLVNSAFDPFDMEQVWERRPACYDGGWMAHFWPKSFEEFSLKKARGDALKMAENEYKRDFEMFFTWNGHETDDNRYEADPEHISRVKAKIAELRAFAGVLTAELEVNRRFRKLIGRYDTVGGLKKIYEQTRQGFEAGGEQLEAF